MNKQNSKLTDCIDIFRRNNGVLRTSQALALGIHPRTLYQLRDEGVLEQLSLGVYRLTEMRVGSHSDIQVAAIRLPKGVICLISALAFHEITTQIPHHVDVAYKHGWKTPRINYPPIKIYRFSETSFESGYETKKIQGIEVKIYCPEKTIVDCFKFRNSIGLDVVIEALSMYWRKKNVDIKKLNEYAKICRVEKIIKPYLESLMHE